MTAASAPALPTTILGRTGLRVSKLGLGCGGPSRLGLKRGASRDDAVRVIRHAIERGINFIDTAEAYTTEPQVARAIRGAGRDGVIVSTKKAIVEGERVISVGEFTAGVHDALKRLQTDRIDLFNLHAVHRRHYRIALETFVPAMLKLRDQGKVRFLGITEDFNIDHRHQMLRLALRSDCWDVIMVGFNILNQTARQSVLPQAARKNIGTLGMFVVRRALSNPDRLRTVVAQLVRTGRVRPDRVDPEDPLGFVIRCGAAVSVADAAYRLSLHEPGMHVTLTGTGSVEHLDDNIASALRPPLAPDVVTRLREVFARVDNVCGN